VARTGDSGRAVCAAGLPEGARLFARGRDDARAGHRRLDGDLLDGRRHPAQAAAARGSRSPGVRQRDRTERSRHLCRVADLPRLDGACEDRVAARRHARRAPDADRRRAPAARVRPPRHGEFSRRRRRARGDWGGVQRRRRSAGRAGRSDARRRVLAQRVRKRCTDPRPHARPRRPPVHRRRRAAGGVSVHPAVRRLRLVRAVLRDAAAPGSRQPRRSRSGRAAGARSHGRRGRSGIQGDRRLTRARAPEDERRREHARGPAGRPHRDRHPADPPGARGRSRLPAARGVRERREPAEAARVSRRSC